MGSRKSFTRRPNTEHMLNGGGVSPHVRDMMKSERLCLSPLDWLLCVCKEEGHTWGAQCFFLLLERERDKSKTSKQVLSMPYLESIPLCSILVFISIRSTLERNMDYKRLLFHLLIPSSLIKLFSQFFIGPFRYSNDYSAHTTPLSYVRTPFPNFYILDLNSSIQRAVKSPY